MGASEDICGKFLLWNGTKRSSRQYKYDNHALAWAMLLDQKNTSTPPVFFNRYLYKELSGHLTICE